MLLLQPQRRGNAVRDGRTVIEGRKLAKPRALIELFLYPTGDLEGEPSLADPTDTGQGHQRPFSKSFDNACDVVLASDETRGAPRHARTPPSGDRNARHRRWDIRSGIAVEDLLMRLAQCRTRVCAQLIDEPFAHHAECLERVGLSATTELGQHQLPGQPLVKWMGRRHRRDLRQQFAVAAGAKSGVVAVQGDCKALGFQRRADIIHPRRVERRERDAAPHRQRPLE